MRGQAGQGTTKGLQASHIPDQPVRGATSGLQAGHNPSFVRKDIWNDIQKTSGLSV